MRKNKKIFDFFVTSLFSFVLLGKERIFLEVARALRKKVHVTAAKLRLLKCLEFKEEDIQWFTSNEHESNIHVAPMWTLASFKRLKQISSQYKVSVTACFSGTGTVCLTLWYLFNVRGTYLDVCIHVLLPP